jgi:hypothetical protein
MQDELFNCSAHGSHCQRALRLGRIIVNQVPPMWFTFAFAFLCCFAVVVTFSLSWLLLALCATCDRRAFSTTNTAIPCDWSTRDCTSSCGAPKDVGNTLRQVYDPFAQVLVHCAPHVTSTANGMPHATTLEGDKSYHCADYRRLDFL